MATNDKRRFELSTDADSDELYIRAIQGHGAMLAIDSEKAMQRITDADRYPLVLLDAASIVTSGASSKWYLHELLVEFIIAQ